MKYDIAAEIQATKDLFRREWREKWQSEYCMEHKLFRIDPHICRQVPDLSRAPEPLWDCYTDPEFVGIKWETGFAVITAEAFAKMPQSKINKLMGGTHCEKHKNVRRK